MQPLKFIMIISNADTVVKFIYSSFCFVVVFVCLLFPVYLF